LAAKKKDNHDRASQVLDQAKQQVDDYLEGWKSQSDDAFDYYKKIVAGGYPFERAFSDGVSLTVGFYVAAFGWMIPKSSS